ncbi:Transcription factor IIS, N-terminal [Dillenia turbinata]|uniref:Transcription factor IIS, N-terminal n=1 Tax=Dillenia turbinata TaxID=194707 RepID=A0AAN8VXK6_9MAGN
MESDELNRWRDFFRTSNSDIFDIIERAIMVAACDCPKEFRLRRDRIAERLFSCRLMRCVGCDRVELGVPEDDEEEGVCKSGLDRNGCEFEAAGGSKESKVNSSREDDHVDIEMNTNHVSNYSYGEAEALTNELEEAHQMVGEVFRIKEILENHEEESDCLVYDSLRRLQLMALTVDTLEATGIGKTVAGVSRRGKKDIRQLAKTLIGCWKVMVDEWVKATRAVEEGTPDSVNPSVVDEEEEGLPSPPLDEGAFFAAPTASMELSQFWDGMDDDGNPRNSGEFSKNRDNWRSPSMEKQHVSKPPMEKQRVSRQKPPSTSGAAPMDNKVVQQMKKQEVVMKPNRITSAESGPGRPPKQNSEYRGSNEAKLQVKSDKAALQRRAASGQQEKLRYSDEAAVRVKLEASKRKLQEGYQQAENAKKQRTIQVMELHDLPKQGLGHRNLHVKPGNHNNRNWGHGRR